LVARYLDQDGTTSVATFALTGLASVVLLMAVLRTDAPLLRVPLFSWLVYLGRISYGLYVFHLLALALMMNVLSVPVLGIPLSFGLRVTLSFLLTVALAIVSYSWLEKPFLKLKERFTYRRAADPRETRSMRPTSFSGDDRPGAVSQMPV
jgi:peptidoglycan/LPS O-acetylase OafA/YrhL